MTAVAFPHGWTPQGLSDLLWWIDASDLSTIAKDGSNLVSAWNDKSGHGYHAAQGTGPSQPQWLATGLNGLPTIEFLSKTMLAATFAHTAAGAAFFAIGTLINGGISAGRMVSLAADGVNDSGVGAFIPLRRPTTLEQIGSTYNGAAYGGIAVTYTVPFLWVSMVDGTNGFTGLNGGTLASNPANGTNDFDQLVLGANCTSSGNPGTTYMHGRLSEVVMLAVAPGANLRQRIEGYLAWKWGNEGHLNGAHPWRQRAP